MSFNSFEYALFLPVTLFAYFAIPEGLRWVVLLLASCAFYMAFIPAYILVLFAIIVIDYLAGIGIEKSVTPRARKAVLLLSICANLGVLMTFKYYDWLAGSLTSFPLLKWALPIGLSFHTFQSLSYTLEVFHGRFKAERHLGIYAVYVLYFPQMVAGPIERPQNVLPQLRRARKFDDALARSGLRLILTGLLKKCVVADNLAPYVDQVFSAPTRSSAAATALATLFFTVQIYCDFSGYSDMARGSSRLFGIELMRNFDAPYLAGSIRDFWRRWHISLSTWFRDYVYIPLGGNRRTQARNAFNLFVVFLLSGLWHGANWTYLAWGALHGFYLCINQLAPRSVTDALGRVPGLNRLLTLAAVSLAWIFFRADSVQSAFTLLSTVLRPSAWSLASVSNELGREGMPTLILATVAVPLWDSFERSGARLGPFVKSRAFRWAVYYAAIAAFAVLGKFEGRQFVYFQF